MGGFFFMLVVASLLTNSVLLLLVSVVALLVLLISRVDSLETSLNELRGELSSQKAGLKRVNDELEKVTNGAGRQGAGSLT